MDVTIKFVIPLSELFRNVQKLLAKADARGLIQYKDAIIAV